MSIKTVFRTIGYIVSSFAALMLLLMTATCADPTQGMIKKPEINVKAFNNDILNGRTIECGSVALDSSKIIAFVIENIGTLDLNLSDDDIKVTVSGAGFSVTKQPSLSVIEPLQSTIFNILFAPTEQQEYSAIVNIENNDKDEGIYTFTAKGRVPKTSIPKTGQITAYYSGDDGSLQKGVTWPVPRFTINDDYTITDNLTRIMWYRSPTSVSSSWIDAVVAATSPSPNGGYYDWRLPNYNEQYSLSNYNESNNAAWLNLQGFSVIQVDQYWSSTTNPYDADSAWCINMTSNTTGDFDKESYQRYFLSVRSLQGDGLINLPVTGQTIGFASSDDGYLQKGDNWPSPRFMDNLDGTISDNLTGLMWERVPVDISISWEEALDYCNDLALSEYSDWRLPNIREISSLANQGSSDILAWLNEQGFIILNEGEYWTSTTNPSSTGRAYTVFLSGSVYHGQKINSYYVLAVR